MIVAAVLLLHNNLIALYMALHRRQQMDGMEQYPELYYTRTRVAQLLLLYVYRLPGE